MPSVKSKSKRTRRSRGSLSQEEILAGARELVERSGLDALSMPRLARELGSGVTSIYWYFRSKDELLVALAAQVSEELYAQLPPVSEKPWAEEFESYFVAFRDEIKRKHAYLELFTRYPRFLFAHADLAKTLIPRLEQELSVLVRAGLTAEEAAEVYSSCSIYTRGFVLIEHDLAGEQTGADPERVDHVVAGLDREAFPHVTSLRSFDEAMRLDDQRFRTGLRLMIDGIRSRFRALDESTN